MKSIALRFGLFADSHYAEMVYGDRYCRDSPAKLRACIEVFKRQELAFVVCMGDLIDKAEKWETELGYLLEMRAVFEEYEGERPTVALCHENLDDRMEDKVPISYAVRNAAQVRQVLEEAGNVRAVIQAHYHPGLCATIGGIAYIGLRAMVVGAGLENNAFAIAALRDDGKVELEGFGQQESFTTGRSG